MRVLICGARDYQDTDDILYLFVVGLSEYEALSVVIDGAARGADTLAHMDARLRGMETERYPVEWPPEHSPKWQFADAAFKRNQRMLDEGHPDLVIAFKDGFDWKMQHGGTEDMVRRAKEAGVPVYVVSRP